VPGRIKASGIHRRDLRILLLTAGRCEGKGAVFSALSVLKKTTETKKGVSGDGGAFLCAEELKKYVSIVLNFVVKHK
jgi:hypothetical protein